MLPDRWSRIGRGGGRDWESWLMKFDVVMQFIIEKEDVEGRASEQSCA